MYEMEDNVEEIGSRLGRQVARMRARVVTETILEVEARITRLVVAWGRLNREREWLKGLE